MSGVTAYAGGDAGTYDLLVAQSTQIKTSLDTLSEQAATGLVSTVFSGLGGSAATALDLRGDVAVQQSELDGINSADQKLTLTQSVLTQISGIASSFYAATTALNDLDPSNVDVQAANARAALQQVAGLLNSQDGGAFIFGAAASGTAPVPQASDFLNSPFVAAITGAVQGLATNGAAATTASTLATASSNAPGTSPFSAQLSQPASALQSGLPSVQIGPGVRLTIGVAASANAAAVSTGPSTTGSYIRDLLRSLATIGALSSSQVNAAGFDALVADTRTSLGGAVAAISDEQGILGNTQARVDGTAATLTATQQALSTQVSNIQNVDIAQVSTQLSQTQTELQASYKLIAGYSDNSLLKYL